MRKSVLSIMTILGGMVTSFATQAQILESPSAEIGASIQVLTLASPISVPTESVAPQILELNSKGGRAAVSVFMSGGKVLIDRRSDVAKILKSFNVLLAEQRRDYCEISFIPKVVNGLIGITASMKLEYFGQGGETKLDGKASLLYRMAQERNRANFESNEVTWIKCTTFNETSLKTGRVPVSVLIGALGPSAQVTR